MLIVRVPAGETIPPGSEVLAAVAGGACAIPHPGIGKLLSIHDGRRIIASQSRFRGSLFQIEQHFSSPPFCPFIINYGFAHFKAASIRRRMASDLVTPSLSARAR
jgi:hypothetical protein